MKVKQITESKKSGSLAGNLPFFRKLESCAEDYCVFDIETGEANDVGVSNKYGISPSEYALSHFTGQILLSGLLIKGKEPIFISGQEDEMMARTASEIGGSYRSAAKIIAHNGYFFDFPFLMKRMSLLKKEVPSYMVELLKNRNLIDTYKMCEQKAPFPSSSISLKDLSKLWGRPFVSFGANFGRLWQNEIYRDTLLKYNLLNLYDSLALAVFSGAIKSNGLPNAQTSGFKQDFKPIDIRFLECTPKAKKPCVENVSSACLVVSPFEIPKNEKAVFGKRSRFSPSGCRIVGYGIASGKTLIWKENLENEAELIVMFVEEICERVKNGEKFHMESVGDVRNLLSIRGSIYGLVMPDEFTFPSSEWAIEVDGSVLEEASSISDVVSPGDNIYPIHCGDSRKTKFCTEIYLRFIQHCENMGIFEAMRGF